jgi:hypothetical protein
VLANVLTVNVTVAEAPLVGVTELGWNWQLAPEGGPEQESVTEPVNAPSAEIRSEIGPLTFPGTTLTLLGEGAPRLKSTMCNVRRTSCVITAESVPTACRLKT